MIARELLRRDPVVDAEFWHEHAAADGVAGADLRRYLVIVWRRRRWVVLVMVLALANAAAYLGVATPVYEARVKLLIESQSPNVVNFKEVLEQNTGKLDYYETQLGILRSRTLARKTIEALDMWEHPAFASRPSGLSATLKASFPLKYFVAPAPAQETDETAAQSRAIDAFLGNLTISYRAANRLFDAGFRSTDPRVSADVANTLARVFIEQDLEMRTSATRGASDWLNARLAAQRKHVENSEMALQRYREQNSDIAVSETQNLTAQRLAELTSAATRAKAERIELEAMYKQLQPMAGASPAAVALPAALGNSFLNQLKVDTAGLRGQRARLLETLGERHPEVVKVDSAIQNAEEQLQAEIARIANGVRTQLTAVEAKERDLTAALAAQERIALALNRKAIEYGVLQREATTNRQIFEALLERAKQTEISSELKTTNIQVVDPAEVPLKPRAPQPLLIVLLAFVLGLPTGVGAALLVHHLDDRIVSAEQVRSLATTLLGIMPALPANTTGQQVPLIGEAIPWELSGAIRTIRANLLSVVGARGTCSLVVTSRTRGEGRTLLASNLAIALGQDGRRVLLIDADMQRCRVHELFRVPLTPGLAEVLGDVASIESAIRSSNATGVAVLPAGSAPGNPGDLLDSPMFEALLATLGDEFDWVIIDSPPVALASDAVPLAHAASGVLFVVRTDTNRTRNVRAALDQLESAGASVLGAVLSHVAVPLSGRVTRTRSALLGAGSPFRAGGVRCISEQSCNTADQKSTTAPM